MLKAEIFSHFSASVFTGKTDLQESQVPVIRRKVWSRSHLLCYEYKWQGFGSGGATGVASVTSCEKLPTCLIYPMPAGSQEDPPLAKAKPVSNGGSTSVITHVRRGKKLQ